MFRNSVFRVVHGPRPGPRVAAGIALMALAALPGLLASAPASAEEVNLYTSRHYQTDEKLYADFTEATGIEVNRIEGKAGALLERLRSEGANSPADILMTVDAGMLWRVEEAGLFAPVESPLLDEKIPENLRHPDGHWFGFSTRARLIYTSKERVEEGAIGSYEALADPKWQGKVCIRSSSNLYNQSLVSSLIDADGAQATQDWADGVVANMARPPQGGDTDQLKAVAAGECDVAVANSYYYLRLVTSEDEADREIAAELRPVFPNQDGRGTHVNISGAGLLKHAPHKAAAVRFLEYLASEQAQHYFADGNNEFPAVPGVEATAAVQALGAFKIDPVNVSVYGENQPEAQKLMDRAGWK